MVATRLIFHKYLLSTSKNAKELAKKLKTVPIGVIIVLGKFAAWQIILPHFLRQVQLPPPNSNTSTLAQHQRLFLQVAWSISIQLFRDHFKLQLV
jgi:hypothetical protein